MRPQSACTLTLAPVAYRRQPPAAQASLLTFPRSLFANAGSCPIARCCLLGHPGSGQPGPPPRLVPRPFARSTAFPRTLNICHATARRLPRAMRRCASSAVCYTGSRALRNPLLQHPSTALLWHPPPPGPWTGAVTHLSPAFPMHTHNRPPADCRPPLREQRGAPPHTTTHLFELPACLS